MEFTIGRNEILAGLYLTQGIVERRTTIPILGNVLIQSADEGVMIAATDQEIGVRRFCAAKVKRKGMLTTPARKLYEMMRELPEGDVKIRSLENSWIEISSGRSRFRLVGMDPREFPAMPEPPASASFLRLPGESLAGMIEYTLFSVSADEARPNLNGIYLECEDSRLRAVATDGHRLAMVTRPVEGEPLEKGIVIPRKAILELRKVLESGEEPIAFTVAGGMAHVQRGPVQMSMRLVEGEFPDYRQVLPKPAERMALLDVASFLSALRRVSIVSSERTRGVKLQLEGDRLELSSINPDVGEAADEVEVEYGGEALSIGFNARYLIDVLGVMPGGGRVELGLIDGVSPGVLREVGDPDYCYIVMPMRL